MKKEIIQDDKYVELKYKIIDRKSGDVLKLIEYGIGYVHGSNEVLASNVTEQLTGKTVGDVIEVPVDSQQLYGDRDESLVFTDHIESVPEEYREVGTTIVMENSKGEPKEFIVTRMDDKTLTVDGNNPLCGREVVFRLEIIEVRDASEEEIELGGKVGADPDINEILQ